MKNHTSNHHKFNVGPEFPDFCKDASGLEFGDPVEHCYVYLTSISKSDQFAMLRVKTAEGVHKLDHKARADKTGGWIQEELIIDNPARVINLLTSLGSNHIATINKRIRTYSNDYAILKLVTVEGLCHVLEVKYGKEDTGKVTTLLSNLQIDFSKRDNRSIVEIYLDSIEPGDQ